MLVTLKNILSTLTVAALLGASAWAQAQAPAGQAQQGQSDWKDRAEYDLYEAAAKEQDANKRLQLLNQWKEKYPTPAANPAKLRLALYLDTYQKLNQAQPMFDTAKQMLANDPKDPTALYWLTLLTPSIPNAMSNPDLLSTGEKGARGLIENLDTTFAADKKPANATEDQWKKARTDSETQAYRTLGWVAMARKDAQGQIQNFEKSLQINPAQGDVSYWLGNAILGTKDLTQYPRGLYHIARAASYDGPGALPEAGRKQVDAFLTKAYTGYHGDTSGLQELKAQAKANVLPPADFKIASVTDVEKAKLEKEAEFEKSNPELAIWRRIKNELVGENGQQYFDTGMKDAATPKLTGKVVSQTPKSLMVAVDGDQPEITLQLAEGTFPKVDPGTTVSFEGVSKSYTKDPFMLIVEAEGRSKITGLPAAAAAKKPGAARSKRRR